MDQSQRTESWAGDKERKLGAWKAQDMEPCRRSPGQRGWGRMVSLQGFGVATRGPGDLTPLPHLALEQWTQAGRTGGVQVTLTEAQALWPK